MLVCRITANSTLIKDYIFEGLGHDTRRNPFNFGLDLDHAHQVFFSLTLGDMKIKVFGFKSVFIRRLVAVGSTVRLLFGLLPG